MPVRAALTFLVVLISLLAPTCEASAMTTAPAKGHCKTMSHLRVSIVQPSSQDVGVGGVTVQRFDDLNCPNVNNYAGWGVVLTDAHHKSGLKLTPDAVSGLPPALRSAASAGQSVLLQHTGGGTFFRWDSFTNAEALSLADLIAAA